VADNLFWALVGLLAVSGPASGTPLKIKDIFPDPMLQSC
jgi:hypothetical protein